MPRDSPRATLIIPAHNEESSIARLLDALLPPGAPADEFEILVLPNGCTDRTVEIARGYEPAVRVVEVSEASKRAALRRGNELATGHPRVYIDADVLLDAAAVRALTAALHPPVMVAAPARAVPRDGVSWPVRAYYDVWEHLPQVRSAPFGRGVVAVSREGAQRISALPPAMSDDLAVAAAFRASERAIVADAVVTVWPPRTVADLVRRRVRVHTGNAQLAGAGGVPAELSTSPGSLLRLVRSRPRIAAKLPVFVAVTVVAKLAARRRIKRGDFTTWLRDESSRRPPTGG
jgi:glycosyltransferase involved in cell wall biosynthesis